MSSSFRPQEAREDTFVLGIVAAVIMSMATLIFASSTYHSGLKYIVLTLSGLEVQSNIVSVRDLGDLSIEQRRDMDIYLFSHNDDSILEVFIEFTDRRGEDIIGSFLVLEGGGSMREGSPLPIIYSRLNSNIFLPAHVLSDYRTDARIFLIAAGVIFFCATSAVVLIWRWFVFRSKMRRY